MKSPLFKTKWYFILAALTLPAMLAGGCSEQNNSPVISSLISEKWLVEPAQSCEIECIASDADNDSLTYTWSATGGAISGEGPVIIWKAPDASGTSNITVSVADGRGGVDTRQLTVNIFVNHPPVIESLTAEPTVVDKGGTSVLECIAYDADGDELVYKWTAQRGSILGEGATVNWTGPLTSDNYTVELTVADQNGEEAQSEISIRVRGG